jgi:rubrerythrin
MAELKGSSTERNLLAAFVGESQARNRYTFFAERAIHEGYEQIACFFLETAANEKEHAKVLLSFLGGGTVHMKAGFSAEPVASTLDNLKAAASGEYEEHTQMYPEFAAVAQKEGFPSIARAFKALILIEKEHEQRYRKLYNKLRAGTVFTSTEPVHWKCRNCGYPINGRQAPQKCPFCSYTQAFFEIAQENY